MSLLSSNIKLVKKAVTNHQHVFTFSSGESLSLFMVLRQQPLTKTGKGKRSSENRENLKQGNIAHRKAVRLSEGIAVVCKNCEHLEMRLPTEDNSSL